MSPDEVVQSAQAANYFNAYLEHAKILRTWFVAYGIGAPVLFISQKEAWEKVAQVGHGKMVVALFLLGVISQILLTFNNKVTMWIVNYGLLKPKFKESKLYKRADRWSEYFIVDFIMDALSIGLFSIATYLTLTSIVSAKPLPTSPSGQATPTITISNSNNIEISNTRS